MKKRLNVNIKNDRAVKTFRKHSSKCKLTLNFNVVHICSFVKVGGGEEQRQLKEGDSSPP